MGRSRLSTRFTLYDWNKFSKEFKKNYKKENEKPLEMNTAVYFAACYAAPTDSFLSCRSVIKTGDCGLPSGVRLPTAHFYRHVFTLQIYTNCPKKSIRKTGLSPYL